MDLVTFSKGQQLTPTSLDDVQEEEGYTAEAKKELQDFKSQVVQGDIVYHYCSDPEEWEIGRGSEGYIVVRDGQIIANYLVRMN